MVSIKMPRLLSNKEPTKISEVKVGKKSEQKSFNPPKSKSTDEMTAWEYYSFLMRFGKRKMFRHEWLNWMSKKDEEDIQKRYDGRMKGNLEGRISFAEYNWRIKKDRDFDDMIEEDLNPE